MIVMMEVGIEGGFKGKVVGVSQQSKEVESW